MTVLSRPPGTTLSLSTRTHFRASGPEAGSSDSASLEEGGGEGEDPGSHTGSMHTELEGKLARIPSPVGESSAKTDWSGLFGKCK